MLKEHNVGRHFPETVRLKMPIYPFHWEVQLVCERTLERWNLHFRYVWRSLNFADTKTSLQSSEIQPVPIASSFFVANGVQRRSYRANPGLNPPVLGRSGSKKAFYHKQELPLDLSAVLCGWWKGWVRWLKHLYRWFSESVFRILSIYDFTESFLFLRRNSLKSKAEQV